MRFTQEENFKKIRAKIRRKKIWNISGVCCIILAVFLLFQCSFTRYQKSENLIKFHEVALDIDDVGDISVNMVKKDIQEFLPWLPEVSLTNEKSHYEFAYECVNKGCMEAGFEHYELFSSSDEADLLLSISTDNRGPVGYWDIGGSFESIMENKEKSILEGYEVWLIKNTNTLIQNEYILYTKIHDYYVYLQISGNYSEEQFLEFTSNFLQEA